MAKIKIGVIRGGPSLEYEISLLSGESVINNLPRGKYDITDILWTKDGIFHENGFAKRPAQILKKLDLVFNALHGEYGEDGRIQQIFELNSIPYTGSGIFASAVAMKKHLALNALEKRNIKMPRSIIVSKGDDLEARVSEICKTLFPWWVIKPASRGSSVGVTIAKSEKEILAGLKVALKLDKKAIAQEHIKGKEATCAVLENFRGQKYYALPIIEIVPPKGKFFNYEVKYDGSTKEICPGRFSEKTALEIKNISILAHEALGLRHYSRSDFIVSPRGIFFLETNTLPGLTSQSLLPKAAQAAGLPFPLLLDHIASLAIRGA